MYGAYGAGEGRDALRFERRLAHPVDAVWRAVTDPAELEHWFPTRVEGDVRSGGRLRFTHRDGAAPPMEGEVTAMEPPHRLAFSWGGDQLDLRLEPSDDGGRCVLRFTVVFDQRDKAARDAAGWHVCLDRLEGSLGGARAVGLDSSPAGGWRDLYEEYARRGLPTGARVPG
jgi:uncharacterized protein YndB with AHSA1/START domain